MPTYICIHEQHNLTFIYTDIYRSHTHTYPEKNLDLVISGQGCPVSPWIRGPRDKKAVRRTSERSERRNRTSGKMKSKPRSDELSPSHQSGTCSWSAQLQVTLWPHHTLKQQIWQQNNCTVGLQALLTAWKSFLLIIK